MSNRAKDQSDTSPSAKSLTAKIGLSQSEPTVETVPDLFVKFSLKNKGRVTVDPVLTQTELVIDGKPFEQSAQLFGNGPRDARFSSLPAGETIDFSYAIGYYFRKPGEHTLLWRGPGFEPVQLKFRVAPLSGQWKEVARCAWATVSVERALYRKEGSKDFFVHVRIDNLLKRPIGFVAGDRYQVFYPNQWAESELPRRQVISEMRRLQKELSTVERQKLLALFASGAKAAGSNRQVRILPGNSSDYYVSFNAGGRERVEAVKLPYLIVVMDGVIDFSDGKELYRASREMNDSNHGEVALLTPVKLKDMPADALIF
ncbi:MAG: hypothetical protein HY986_14005 [Candidatus Melainabacteria bacterium]|nr:hypothetical protein [Candidatus Melainabacteria bacterium]